MWQGYYIAATSCEPLESVTVKYAPWSRVKNLKAWLDWHARARFKALHYYSRTDGLASDMTNYCRVFIGSLTWLQSVILVHLKLFDFFNVKICFCNFKGIIQYFGKYIASWWWTIMMLLLWINRLTTSLETDKWGIIDMYYPFVHSFIWQFFLV